MNFQKHKEMVKRFVGLCAQYRVSKGEANTLPINRDELKVFTYMWFQTCALHSNIILLCHINLSVDFGFTLKEV